MATAQAVSDAGHPRAPCRARHADLARDGRRGPLPRIFTRGLLRIFGRYWRHILCLAGQLLRGANPVEPIFIGNPMTFGSSGGAWNIDWTSSAPGYVDGHNDYGYSSQPDAV